MTKYMDNALTSLKKGNELISELNYPEVEDTVFNTVKELFNDGSLNDEYAIIEDYSIRWHKPEGESELYYEIGIELLKASVVINEWYIHEFQVSPIDLFCGRKSFFKQIALEIMKAIYEASYRLNTPKTVSISDFCKKLSDYADMEIEPDSIIITGGGLELVLPEGISVLFDALDNYRWGALEYIDYYNNDEYTNFDIYFDSLNRITEYLDDNNVNLYEIDC
jgi:hypothetical protein